MNVTVGANEVSSGRLTLEPGVVTTVSLPDSAVTVQVISDGSAAAYFTTDGSTPSIDGSNTFELPAGVQSIDERSTSRPYTTKARQVRIVSAGSPSVRVQLA